MIDWEALDMELERGKRDFERRVEGVGREIQERIERVEERCKKEEKARRSEWEKLEGRMMTAEENQQRRSDELLRLTTAVGHEHIKIIRALGEDMHNEFQETRAENRAQSDALLKMMDRLPPN